MSDYSMSLNQGPMSLQVHVDGKAKPIYFHDGRYFVAIRPTAKVAVAVQNRSPSEGSGRIEVLMSVDGRDVLVDQAAAFANGGMVVRYGETWTNRGWRIDSDIVKPFVFTLEDLKTIAVQATGSAAKLGVIGVAVFEELVVQHTAYPPMLYEEIFRRTKGGMGMGEQPIHDPVSTTTFRRSTPNPVTVLEIQYRTLEELARIGLTLVGDDVGRDYPPAFYETGGYGGYRPVR